MADTIMQPTLEDIAQAFGLEPDAPLQPPRFAKVTAVADDTVTVTLGTQTVEAVRCCVCSAGDVVLLETLPSGRLAAVGTRGATSTTYTAGANITIADGVISATDTTYTAGTGLTLSGTTLNHSNAVTAGTIGTASATSGASIAVPYATYDAQGHITARGTHTHTVNGISLTSAVTGTLPIANGGTGATTARGAWLNTTYYAMGGGSGTNYTGWFKVASGTLTTNTNADISFYVKQAYQNRNGILRFNIRSNGSNVLSVAFFDWLVCNGFSPANFLIGLSGNTWTLYVYDNIAYQRVFLFPLGSIALGSLYGSFDLYQTSTPESSTPSGTASTLAEGVPRRFDIANGSPVTLTVSANYRGTLSVVTSNANNCGEYLLATTGAGVPLYKAVSASSVLTIGTGTNYRITLTCSSGSLECMLTTINGSAS